MKPVQDLQMSLLVNPLTWWQEKQNEYNTCICSYLSKLKDISATTIVIVTKQSYFNLVPLINTINI